MSGLAFLPSALAVCGAAYLLAVDKDGWGWLSFIALVLAAIAADSNGAGK